MKSNLIACCAILAAALGAHGQAGSGYTTPAATQAELESLYTASIERRAADILEALQLSDAPKAQTVRTIIVNQYRALRARDSVISSYLTAKGLLDTVSSPEREELFDRMTPPLHDLFVDTLSVYLTPEQVDVVKDELTYNKVKVTFDAYCSIVPGLEEPEKAMILDGLKRAREVAICGGSADEKHAIFERYKQQINANLKVKGFDVEKATREWEARQSTASSSGQNPPGTSN